MPPLPPTSSADRALALDCYVKLTRASNSVSGALARSLSFHGLTEGQFGVLEALFHLGPLSQKALGRKLLRSGPNVCIVVDNLERLGLVTRSRDSHDRRVVNVSLTAGGTRLMRRIFPGHAAAITNLMGALTSAEQALLARLCKRLGLSVRERESTRSFPSS